ncbi:poly(R)-hydroxyalkanoic acid synthase subunit PhaE [Peptoniphilus raoultii]|uniref:poly(R)-hydroxyalkanoic acid synthase subunit PhaE n=1 Tax=Peptoniphilus raoultii TaxID=1776387 RepID=UPI0008D9034B|nr:poly(R)-hydroxyalkanoic acid synthase subunit PhaE [Peptoniphilus raoultii]
MEKDFNPFEEYFKSQKKLMDMWGDYGKNYQDFFWGDAINPFKTYESMMEFYKKEGFFNYEGSPMEVMAKIKGSSDIYYKLYLSYKEIYKSGLEPSLENAKKVIEDFKREGLKTINNYLFPLLPLDLQEVFKKAFNLNKTYNETFNLIYGPWLDTAENLMDYFMKGALSDPEGFIEFFNIWKENYDKTFAKLLNSPQFGIDRNQYENNMQTFDKFIKFINYFAELSLKLYKLVDDSTEEVIKESFNMIKEGKNSATFEEFYNYWRKKVSDNFDKLFYSDEFSKFLGNFVDSLTVLKKDLDKLIIEGLKNLPIPTNEDMDSLYKSVYELKKEVRQLKKMLREKDEQAMTED